jgi:hypothetical protein
MDRRRAAWSEIGSDAIRFRSYLLGRVVSPRGFVIMLRPGRTAMTNAESNEKDGGGVTRLRDRAHQIAALDAAAIEEEKRHQGLRPNKAA